MATQKPIVLINGKLQQLPAGDTIEGAPAGGGGGSGDVVGPATSVNNKVPVFSGTTGKLLKQSSLTTLDDGLNTFGHEVRVDGAGESFATESACRYIEPFGYLLQTGVKATFVGPLEKSAMLMTGPFSTPGAYLVSGSASVVYTLNQATTTAVVSAAGGFDYSNVTNGVVFGIGPLGQLKLGTGLSVGTNNQVMTSRGTTNSPIWQTLKTVNGNSLLGTGDIVISGGGGAGTGDVVGPASSAADSLPTFADATGKLLKSATHFDIPDLGNIPAAPAAGFLRVFARNRAGRALPHIIGPAGIDVALQPAMFGNSIYQWLPGAGTTVSIAWGTTFTARNAGTAAAQAHPVKASTNALTSLNRATFATGTTATGSSGIQSTNTVAWRGNAANLGGFFFFTRLGVETHEAAMRYMVGLSALNNALAGEPSVQANSILLAKDSTDTTWQIVTRNANTTTKTPTGLAITAGQVLDFLIFCKPNDTKITVRLVDAVTGTVYVDDLDITTNLPVNTTFLYMHAQCMSTVGTTAKVLALNRMYLETDL